MATATLKRFDSLLKQCSLHAQTGNLLNWKNSLMDLRRNLSSFMPPEDFKEVTDKFNSLPERWIASNGKPNPRTYATVNKTFDDIYIIFIKVMRAKGLLMPKPIDTGKAVIEM